MIGQAVQLELGGNRGLLLEVEPRKLLVEDAFEVLLPALDGLPLAGDGPGGEHDEAHHEGDHPQDYVFDQVLSGLAQVIGLAELIDDISRDEGEDGEGCSHDEGRDAAGEDQRFVCGVGKAKER